MLVSQRSRLAKLRNPAYLQSMKGPVIEVELTSDLKQFVVEKVKRGGYSDSGEVVRRALRDLRAKEDSADCDSNELAELLIPAVRGPHRPMLGRDFEALRRRARHVTKRR